MHIYWNIKKERGNLRPVLEVSMELTEYEQQLCVPVICLVTDIPKPPDAGWKHCLPGENERATKWQPVCFHQMQTPHYKQGNCREHFILPWRHDNDYPEVTAALETLRKRFEAVLKETADSGPMNITGELETSAAAKRHLAPAFAAQRILGIVK